VAFVSFTGKYWQIFLSNKYFGNDKGGFSIANPLPPLGTVFFCSLLPVSFSNTHICSQISQTLINDIKIEKDAKLIKYDEIKSVSVIDKDVFINWEMFVKCCASTQAIFIKDILLKLILLKDEQLENEIKIIIQETFDIETAKQKIEAYNSKSYMLRACCNLLFIYIFLIVPLLIYFYGTIKLFVSLLIIMYLLSISVSVIFYSIHKIFYPTEKGERMVDVVKMVIFPPTAIRAHDFISLNLLINYHPLTVAKILCDTINFSCFSKNVLIDLKYSLVNNFENEQTTLINKWHKHNLRKHVDAFLYNNNVDVRNLLAAPLQENPSCKSYCPRCEAQYTLQQGSCSTCGSIALIPFNAYEAYTQNQKAGESKSCK